MPETNYTLHFDGSCQPNPGKMQIGIYIYNTNNKSEKYYITKKLGMGTNNVAEFVACLVGIKYIKNILKCNNMIIYGDSNLTINIINNKWNTKHKNLEGLAKLLRTELKNVSFTAQWIPREENEVANDISVNESEYKIIEL